MPPPLPHIRDWKHFRSIRFDPGLWVPPARWVLARHGLASDAPIELASSVHVVAIAGDVVVKLYQPVSDHESGSFEVETAALQMLGGAGLPVPRLLAAGRLDACVAGHRAAGRLPTRWIEEMPGYLGRARPIVLDGAGGTVVTHGDLHAGNVYVHPGPVLAGVLDFNDVRLTDAYYDLVVVHLRTLDADRRLLKTLLDAYEWGPVAPDWRERMMALTIAHDFDELGDALAARPELAQTPSLEALAERIWG